MKILALDTSTEVCSVALQQGDEVITRFDDSGTKNTDIILPMIDGLMAEAGLKPKDLDLVTFARGPGSFTGVRVATGVAQGIAYGVDVPVAPISTLAALALGAYTATGETLFYTINDARMREVYAAVYQVSSPSEVTEVLSERVCLPDDLVAYPSSSGMIVGTGYAAYESQVSAAVGANWSVDNRFRPHAKDLLPLAQSMMEKGECVSAEKALPVYLRDNVAKKKGER